MKEKLLFVTKGGEDCDNGFIYILELAKTLKAGIAMLMVCHRRMVETYEDAMAAVAFAEAGVPETVKELMDAHSKSIREASEKKIKAMTEECRENSVPFFYEIAVDNTNNAIKDFLKKNPGIDMVLLSPNLAENKKGIDLKKLIKNITKPISAISVHAKAEGATN